MVGFDSSETYSKMFIVHGKNHRIGSHGAVGTSTLSSDLASFLRATLADVVFEMEHTLQKGFLGKCDLMCLGDFACSFDALACVGSASPKATSAKSLEEGLPQPLTCSQEPGQAHPHLTLGTSRRDNIVFGRARSSSFNRPEGNIFHYPRCINACIAGHVSLTSAKFLWGNKVWSIFTWIPNEYVSLIHHGLSDGLRWWAITEVLEP